MKCAPAFRWGRPEPIHGRAADGRKRRDEHETGRRNTEASPLRRGLGGWSRNSGAYCVIVIETGT